MGLIKAEKVPVEASPFSMQSIETAARLKILRAQMQAAIDRWYPRGLDMFGRANSRRAARYQHWGLKRRSNETARTEYVTEVAPLIEGLGLTLPDVAFDRHFR